MDWKIGNLTLRELLGIGLLVMLLLAGLLTAWYLGHQQEQLAKELADSSWLALSGQLENARKKADAARESWKNRWKLLAAVADHGPMEEIDGLFEELMVYGSTGDGMEFARVSALLGEKMESMAGTQKFSWWNVL